MSEFKAPDLSAPRYRRKVKNLLNSETLKKFYEKHPNYEGKVDIRTFKAVVTDFNGRLKQGVIDTRDGIEMPENLGYLIITRCNKPKKKNLDFASSIKYGQKVSHRNWDSDNYLAKICYSNYSLKYRFSDRELWGFKPGKTFRQAVSSAFPESYQNYILLSSKTKLSELYKKR